MTELLWSDPSRLPGRQPSKRGVGVAFGPDVAERSASVGLIYAPEKLYGRVAGVACVCPGLVYVFYRRCRVCLCRLSVCVLSPVSRVSAPARCLFCVACVYVGVGPDQLSEQ